MLSGCVLLIAAVGMVCGEVGFDEWSREHGKVYSNWKERLYRESVWNKNMDKIRKHNILHMKNEKSYSMGMNEHGDLTFEEFKHHKTCMKGKNFNATDRLQKSPKVHYKGSEFLPPIGNWSLPEEINFAKLGFVTEIKDQGQCGSCWAFSTTGSLEGQLFRKTGKLINLSEQQLVDCSTKFGNFGCDGGLMDQGFLYIMSVKGLENEKSYPYTAEDGECQYDATKAVGAATGWVDIPSGSEEMLTTALATNGPISVAIDAGNPSFQFYSGGVYDEPACSSENLDHGVLAVGYGVTADTSIPYFVVKNSWGTSWGVDGYIMMSRNGKNQCGIASAASFPTV